MRVECRIEECDIEDGDPERLDQSGICATCTRCGHEGLAYGTGERSIRLSLMSLREECPNGENNFYVAEETGGESRMPEPVVKPWWEK